MDRTKYHLFHISKERLDDMKRYLSLNGYHAEFFGTDILVSENEVHEVETILQDEDVYYSKEEETDSLAWKRLKKALEST